MKNNPTPLDVEKMSFDRLTLVYGERNGRKSAPMNPEATVVATKAGPVEGALDAVKAFFGLAASKGVSEDLQDSIDQQIEQTKRSMLYDAVYSLEYAIFGAINAPGFDDAAKRSAVDSIIEEFGPRISEIVGMIYAEKAAEIESATKAGARHSAADLEAIKTAHDKIGKAKAALDKAHEATSKLLPDANGGNGAEAVPDESGEASKSVPAPVQSEVIDEMTKEEITALVADAVKAAVAEVKPAAEPVVEDATKAADDAIKAANAEAAAKKAIDDAVAAAIEPLKAEVTALTERATKAETEAANAMKALEDAVGVAKARKSAGGHQDAIERPGGDAESAKEAIAKNKNMTIADAVSLLMK